MEKYQSESWQKKGTVFTGSSSIKMWRELDKYFPKTRITNTGFGGSETKDLIFHLNNLVLDFEPTKVFIYEGDNDINSGVSALDIIHDFEKLVANIFNQLPECHLYLFSAKPSPSRWHLKEQYLEFNNALEALTPNPIAG